MKRLRKFPIRIVALAAALASLQATAQAHGVPDSDNSGTNDIVVNTKDGAVRGFVKNGVSTFLGIPYAAPPVGNLRWMPPQPVKKHALLDATEFASNCPQSNALAVFGGPPSVNENCLYLNVFTTGKRNLGSKKPVLVWIHGGGNFDGESNDYDGGKLATGGSQGTPTVVVTINYRLGLFGYLAQPALDSEGHLFANYGTLDQQAALRWVQRNIAAFGGDPNKVALGGQSGGSVDVHANVVSPLATGLFNRAIFQSAPSGVFVTLDAALARGNAFAKAAGCAGNSGKVAKCLRDLSPARILQLQGTIKDNGPFLDPGSENVIIDGAIIPRQLTDAYTSGKFNKMPVMGGDTKDESAFGIGNNEYFSGPPQAPMTETDYTSAINNQFGSKASQVLSQYPSSAYGGSPGMAYNRATSDSIECSANLGGLKLLAKSVPTYGYDFTYQDTPFFLPQLPGFRPLAAHTIDIEYVFDGYHGSPIGVNLDQTTGQPRGLNAKESNLSDQIIGFWTNFADTGNPNAMGRSTWPVFKANKPVFLQEDVPISVESETQFRSNYKCDFWDNLNNS